LTIGPNGQISTDAFGTGKGGDIAVTVAGALSIDGTSSTVPTGITALTGSNGDAGNVVVSAGSLSIVTNGLISVDTLGGTGAAGSVTVNVAGALSIDGSGSNLFTGITSQSGFSSGNAGEVRVSAGSLTIGNGAEISASTFGSGTGGDVRVNTGLLAISNSGEISASTFGSGAGGDVTVSANALSIVKDGLISASTFSGGAGGSVTVIVPGPVSINGTSQTLTTGITSESGTGGGNAGKVTVNAGSLALSNGGAVSASTFGSGAGGDVTVSAGALAITSTGEISASTTGTGAGGNIMVNLSGDLLIDGAASLSAFLPAGIIARTFDPKGGNAGQIIVTADHCCPVNKRTNPIG
jgi:large exoprotein involved in heme utilization and adhesion